jgi:hypothetical protein
MRKTRLYLFALLSLALLFAIANLAPVFAADMLPAHQALADGSAGSAVSVAALLAGFGVPPFVTNAILLGLVLLYILVTEALPFCPSIKANGLVHFFVLACAAMKVNPVGKSVNVDLDVLRRTIAEALPPAAPQVPDAPSPGAAAPEAETEAEAAPEAAAPITPTAAEIAAAQATLATAALQTAAAQGVPIA